MKIAFSYAPILTNTTQATFNAYVDALDIPQIDYFAIGVQNLETKQSISLMSNTEWQRQFVDNQYAAGDPVRRITLHTKRNFIPFNEIDFVDNFGKEVMRQRAKWGIKNGLILMHRSPTHNYMLTLGTGFLRFSALEFLTRHHDQVAQIQTDFIQVVAKEAKAFLPQEAAVATRPCNDAK